MEQFLKLSFGLIENGQFLRLAGPALAVYFCLRRRIWRQANHSCPKMRELYKDGYLPAMAVRSKLAELCGISEGAVSRQIRLLREAGFIEVYLTGRQNIFVLGRRIFGQSDNPEVNGKKAKAFEWYFIDRLHTSFEVFCEDINNRK